VRLPTISANVATTSTLVAAANSNRTFAIVSNTSDTPVWLMLADAGAAIGDGLYLPAGGTWTREYSGAICAVHIGVSGTKTINVIQF